MLKIIWKYEFFHHIFAKQNRNKEFQITVILNNNKIYKMKFKTNIPNAKVLLASSDREGTNMSVHHYRQ